MRLSDFKLLPSNVATADTMALKMPPYFLYFVVMVCVAPFLLTLFGLNFASSAVFFDLKEAANWPQHQQLDAYFYRLPGAFTHTLLEWTAFCTAIFTVCLAFSHYVISKNLTTPVIGAALFLAGCMDAFHTLAADRLIEAVADNRDLIPFTWAICRIFNALILIGGVALLLYRPPQANSTANLKLLVFIFIISASAAYGIIHYCAVSDSLPQTQYPDSLITRPYDVVPLVLYIFAGFFLFPYFYRKQPSVFAHALVIAMIPEAVVELHMAFGSSSLFDHHFNIAHFLKIFAYVVPFCGLLVDYIHTYQAKERESEIRRVAEVTLQKYTHELERSNKELNDFAYIASHDLKAPLRGITQLASWIEQDMQENLTEQTKEYLDLMQNRIKRLEKLLNDLLAYSRVGRKHGDFKQVELAELVKDVFQMLHPPPGFKLLCQQELPTLMTLTVPLEQVFRNLLNNAIKHHDRDEGTLRIEAQTIEDGFEFVVSDDGPGIAPDQQQRVFKIFQTLKPRDEVEGSGIGLAIVKKLLDNYQTAITIESDGIRGTHMRFNWPTEQILRRLINENPGSPDRFTAVSGR